MTHLRSGDLNSNSRKLKIVLLGDRSVGKSSIIRRFTKNNFEDLMSSTVGVDFMTKQIKYKNTNYKLELWDTAGQEKYRSLIKGYLKGADVCIFVYDASRLQSYQALVDWVRIFQSVSTYQSFKIIAMNKVDIMEVDESVEKRKKQIKQKHKQLQQLNQMPISAKTGSNIEQLFEQILHQSWFCKTIHDINTSKTIKTISSERNLSSIKQKYQNCCS